MKKRYWIAGAATLAIAGKLLLRPRDADWDKCRDTVFHSQHSDFMDVDGVRVLFGDGWGLIRASNTQPVLVTRYEALTRARLDAIQREMEDWLRSQGITP